MFVFFQPLHVGSIIGADRLHQIPEALGMIHVQQMADLMSDHVVDNGIWRHHDQPVELNSTRRRAMPPLGFSLPEHDFLQPCADLQVIGQGLRSPRKQ